jgi:hypothetical protein
MDVAYKIVSHSEFKDTEDEVNALLEEHWELHGDLKVISGTPNTYAQAMVKQEHYSHIDAIDHHALVTIDELDGIKYAIESIGEAIENVVAALGHVATGLSDRPSE